MAKISPEVTIIDPRNHQEPIPNPVQVNWKGESTNRTTQEASQFNNEKGLQSVTVTTQEQIMAGRLNISVTQRVGVFEAQIPGMGLAFRGLLSEET